jgi:hypothetical protein
MGGIERPGCVLTSACDAVDGSSTGTRVPRMWALLSASRFGGAKHASDHYSRSRHRQIGLPENPDDGQGRAPSSGLAGPSQSWRPAVVLGTQTCRLADKATCPDLRAFLEELDLNVKGGSDRPRLRAGRSRWPGFGRQQEVTGRTLTLPIRRKMAYRTLPRMGESCADLIDDRSESAGVIGVRVILRARCSAPVRGGAK